jgi:hypothetical protein
VADPYGDIVPLPDAVTVSVGGCGRFVVNYSGRSAHVHGNCEALSVRDGNEEKSNVYPWHGIRNEASKCSVSQKFV